MLVVVEHADLDDVAGARGDGVGRGDRRLVALGLRHLDDRDHALGFGEAVAHAVAEGRRPVRERPDEGDPQDAVVDDLDLDPFVIGRVRDAGHDEHPAGRVDVGREHVDVDGLLEAQEGRVGHGDRRRVAVRRCGHVDADQARRGVRAIGHGVLEVVRAHVRAGEAERAAVEVGRQLHVGLGRHRAEADLPAAAADVAKRVDADLLAGGRERDERLGDEGHVAGRLHRDREQPGRLLAAVGDGERHVARGAGAELLVEHHDALRGRGERVGLRHRGRAQEERIPVGVDPVAEHGRRDPPLHLDGGAVLPLLHRGAVLVGIAHRDGDLRVRGAAPSVADGVSEGQGTGCRLVERELQLLVLRHEVEPRAAGKLAVDPVDDEDIAVGVVVVQQHGEQRRPAGPRTEGVVLGRRRHLALLDGGLRVGIVLLDRLLVVLALEQRVPVVDEPVVVVRRPRRTALPVVEHHDLAVRGEGEVAGAGRPVELEGPDDPVGASAPGLAVAPCGVQAPAVLHGRGRGAADPRHELPRHAAVEVHRDETTAMRDGDRPALERRNLEDGIGGGLEQSRQRDLAALHPQGAGRRVEHRPVLADRRDLHVVVVVDGRELPSRGHGHLVGGIDARDRAGAGRVREEHPRRVDRGHRPGTEVEHRVGVAVEVGESGGGRRPHLAVGGDHHAIPGEGEGGVVGRHGHRLDDGRRGGIDDADARAVAVEHQHRRPLLHDLGARAARLDDGVELEHGRVRPAHRLQLVVRHPDRRVAEVDALGRVAAGCHGHARDDGDHGGHRTRGHERRPMSAQRRDAHQPTPASTSTQRSALGTPDLPSRVTVTVAQTRSPSSTFVSKRGSRCIGRGSPSTVTM